MNHFREHFSSFDGRVWLNAASEGPLPLTAQRALGEAVEWKSKPYLLTNARFASTVVDLKKSIGQLIRVGPGDVVLANSASYGLHILANGLPFVSGDEILLMQNDFPTDILPWLALERKGIKVRQVKPAGHVFTPEEVAAHISAKTRLFCISHVHTFTGFVLDIEKIGEICRNRGVVFAVNLSQSLGTRRVDVDQLPVDAVVAAGYKWLCGPYGTGFAWFSPAILDQLDYNQSYWISALSPKELQSPDEIRPTPLEGARKYDVFATANFFNFVPFKAAVDLWVGIGPDSVRQYQQNLIERFILGLDNRQYTLISPREERHRSALVVFSHRDPSNNARLHEFLLEQGIYTALWKNNLRVSPHVYNTPEEIDGLLAALNNFFRKFSQ